MAHRFLVVLRFAELGLAQRNTVRLLATGGVEFGGSHYPLMVALHVFWLLGLWMFGRGNNVHPTWLAFFILLQVCRLWAIASLGRLSRPRSLSLGAAARGAPRRTAPAVGAGWEDWRC